VDILGVPLLGRIDFIQVRANDSRVTHAAAGRLEPSAI
jgi:hypothetical protein